MLSTLWRLNLQRLRPPLLLARRILKRACMMVLEVCYKTQTEHAGFRNPYRIDSFYRLTTDVSTSTRKLCGGRVFVPVLGSLRKFAGCTAFEVFPPSRTLRVQAVGVESSVGGPSTVLPSNLGDIHLI